MLNICYNDESCRTTKTIIMSVVKIVKSTRHTANSLHVTSWSCDELTGSQVLAKAISILAFSKQVEEIKTSSFLTAQANHIRRAWFLLLWSSRLEQFSFWPAWRYWH